MVGAGIGGLAAARELKRLGAERGLAFELVVLEAADRTGGVIGTERFEGALLERGADSLVTHKPAGISLCRELGLGNDLTFPAPGRTDILTGGRLLPVPAGFALLAPTRHWPLVTTPLLTWRGKLRALAGPGLRPAGPRLESPGRGDESVAAFVRRHFGAELLERIVEPIVGAIRMADVDRLSIAATFPQFVGLESAPGRLRIPRPRRNGRRSAAAPLLMFAALRGGMGGLVSALERELPAGALRLGKRVVHLRTGPEGFELRCSDGDSLHARAVLLAHPATQAAKLLADLDPTLADAMNGTACASCLTVNLAWSRNDVETPPTSHGFFVPRTAGSSLVAAGFVHVKFPERVPPNQIVARLFFGGALHPEVGDLSDARLVDLAVAALEPLLGLRRPPAWVRIFRHPHSLPQPAVGHPELARRIDSRLEGLAGLEVAGGPLGAYGIPDSVAAAAAAARRLFAWLEPRPDSRIGSG